MTLRSIARLGGMLYLVIIILGLFEEVGVRSRVIVPRDVVATLENLQSNETLWRVGIASEYVLLLCGSSLAVIFYILLRPVNKDVALLSVFFNLVSIAVEASTSFNLLAALFPMKEQLPREHTAALTNLYVRSHAHGFGIALIFFGAFCVVAGFLIWKSGYLPKWIGALMMLAGVCYLVNSFALILAPPLAARLFPFILIPPLIGEASFCLWLLFKGVDEARFGQHLLRAPGA